MKTTVAVVEFLGFGAFLACLWFTGVGAVALAFHLVR
jgi:hypothetical protein